MDFKISSNKSTDQNVEKTAQPFLVATGPFRRKHQRDELAEEIVEI